MDCRIAVGNVNDQSCYSIGSERGVVTTGRLIGRDGLADDCMASCSWFPSVVITVIIHAEQTGLLQRNTGLSLSLSLSPPAQSIRRTCAAAERCCKTIAFLCPMITSVFITVFVNCLYSYCRSTLSPNKSTVYNFWYTCIRIIWYVFMFLSLRSD